MFGKNKTEVELDCVKIILIKAEKLQKDYQSLTKKKQTTLQPYELRNQDFLRRTTILHPRPSTSTRIPQQESVPTQRTRL